VVDFFKTDPKKRSAFQRVWTTF